MNGKSKVRSSKRSSKRTLKGINEAIRLIEELIAIRCSPAQTCQFLPKNLGIKRFKVRPIFAEADQERGLTCLGKELELVLEET